MTRNLPRATAIQRASQVVVNATASSGQATETELNALDISCRRWLDARRVHTGHAASGASHTDDSWLGTGNPTRPPSRH